MTTQDIMLYLIQDKRFKEFAEKAIKKGNNPGTEIESISQLKKYGKTIIKKKKVK